MTKNRNDCMTRERWNCVKNTGTLELRHTQNDVDVLLVVVCARSMMHSDTENNCQSQNQWCTRDA